jgi:hypothetical protein
MGSNHSEESSEVVPAYLSYLQEMSRKISLRTGIENTLYGKTKKNPHYYRPFKDGDVDSQYLRNVKNYFEKESERQLFLGNGLIAGSFKKKQTKKYITAPLIYFLVKTDLDENSRSLTYSIEWDSVSLNYDLITLILEQDIDEDDDEGIEFQSAGVDGNKLEVLEDIENRLENILRHEREILMADALAVQIFQQIHEKIPEFNQVDFSAEEFTLKELENLGSKGQLELTFYNHRFFYVASLPGQLSTYTALRKLILEVS